MFLSNAHVNATNYGSGLAGDINIDARNQVLIQNQSEVSGNGYFGRIFVRVSDGSFILDNSKLRTDDKSTDTSNTGIVAGDISISAREVIRIQNESQISSVGNFGRIAFGQSNFDQLSFSPNEIFIDDITSSIDNPTLTTTNSRAGKAGDISLSALNRVSVTNSTITSNTRGTNVNAGSITFTAGSVSLSHSLATSVVEPKAVGNGGRITINATTLSAQKSQLQTQTSGQGDAGSVTLTIKDDISLDNSSIFSTVEAGGRGIGGSISITTKTLLLSNGGSLQTLLRGPFVDAQNPANNRDGAVGNAGVISIQATDLVSLMGRDQTTLGQTGIYTRIDEGADGAGPKDNLFAGNIFNSLLGLAGDPIGSIFISTNNLNVSEGAVLDSSTFGKGNAGAVVVLAPGSISLANNSAILSLAGSRADGQAGGIVVQTGSLSVSNRSKLDTSTFGQGNAGLVFVKADRDISLSGEGSGIFSIVGSNIRETAGGIGISARDLFIDNQAQISVRNDGLEGVAGDIDINARIVRLDQQGRIFATTQSGNGGNIGVLATKYLLLRRDSNISTNAGLGSGTGNGGNIVIRTPFIIAAPSKNNDITANAGKDRGGTVDITSPNGGKTGLFGIRFRLRTNPLTNDITASSDSGRDGTVSINALDTTLVENSLTELAQNLIDPNTLLANSCIARNRDKKRGQNGTFLVTGSGGLPIRPNDAPLSSYPTGEVRSLPEVRGEERGVRGEERQGEQRRQGEQGGQGGQRKQGESYVIQNSTLNTQNSLDRSWQPGDPIVEPQGIYRLANGRLVMSRECEP